MTWREERRRDDAARAEQARQDAFAAAEVEAIRARTQAEAEQALAEHRATLTRRSEMDRRQRRDTARARRAVWVAGMRGWATEHVVDLLIYPLAVVSAVMAVPAMAAFGHEVYGTAAGYALPVITELGMWAFALAVHHTRRVHPARPVWALQVGVWSFAAVAAALNAMHGFTGGAPGVGGVEGSAQAGAVMAVASVAGVMAHQLVTASPRRGRTERDTARMARRAAAKVNRVRRAAVRAAVAEIEPDGSARLVFAPGRYVLARRSGLRVGKRRLAAAVVAGLPVASALDTGWDALDRELAELLANPDRHTGQRGTDDGETPTGRGPVATLDHGTDLSGDQPRSTPTNHLDRASGRGVGRGRSRRGKRIQKTGRSTRARRSIEELRAEMRALVEADPASINPTSAESIRKALGCSPARARQLRDEN